jgi:hypothetical protein
MGKLNELLGEPDNRKEWEKEWVGMPSFSKDSIESYKKIIVHFRNDEDIQKFSELIGQKLNNKSKSCWYPEMPHRKRSHLRYILDE